MLELSHLEFLLIENVIVFEQKETACDVEQTTTLKSKSMNSDGGTLNARKRWGARDGARRKMCVQLNNKITIYLFHEFHSHTEHER